MNAENAAVYLRMYDGSIHIYENVTYKNSLHSFIESVKHEIFNDAEDVVINLDIVYKNIMLTLNLNQFPDPHHQ